MSAFRLLFVLVLHNGLSQTTQNVSLKFLSQEVPYSVINHTNTQLPDNNRGLETGVIIKIDNVYHLFCTELLYPPCIEDNLFWCTTSIGHWESTDKINWNRLATIASGNGICNNTDHNAVYWSPLISFVNNLYYLTYVGYNIPCNYYPDNGIIWLSDPVANIYEFDNYKLQFEDGLPSNFTNTGIQIMNGTGNQSWWEGSKDVVDSFGSIYFGNNDNKTMYSFYGSCCNPNQLVGIAYSTSGLMTGPWIRYENNPINFTLGTENPIITKTVRNNVNYYLAVYCVNNAELKGIGFSWSLDGIHWSNTEVVAPAEPIPYARVPLGLIEEIDGNFTLFYTDFDARHAGNTAVWEGNEGMYFSTMQLIITIDH